MALALSILWILAALLILWGASLMWRGLRPRGRGEGRLTCPACRKAVPSGLMCGACGYEGHSARDFRTRRDWRMFLCGWIPVVAAGAAGVGAEVVRGWFSDEELDLGLGPMRAMAIGVAIFGMVVGVWSWRGDRSRGRRRCPKCWYDMSGSKLVCPECGHDAKVAKRLYRSRRRKRGVAIGGVLLIVAYGVWVIPAVRAGGPIAAVPTWVLIAGLPWWPESMTYMDDPNPEEDWTLHGRMSEERMWKLEKWLLRKRARGVAAGRPSIRSLERVIPFLDDEEDKDLARSVQVVILRGFVSPKQADRNRAIDVGTKLYFLLADPPKEQIREHKGVLTTLLGDDSMVVRGWAAGYLAELGREGDEAVPMIIESLRESGRRNDAFFIISLRMIIKDSEWARHYVISSLDDPDPKVRRGCAYALGANEPLDGLVIARMIALLDDPSDAVASIAARALCRARAEPEIVLPKIFDRVEGSASQEFGLPSYLDRYGLHLQPYMGRLGGLLKSADTREDVLYVLQTMQGQPEQANFLPLLPYLHAIALEEDSSGPRNLARDLIEQFGQPAGEMPR